MGKLFAVDQKAIIATQVKMTDVAQSLANARISLSHIECKHPTTVYDQRNDARSNQNSDK